MSVSHMSQIIPEIEPGSILGLNYGPHDSAVVLLGPDGGLSWAMSLERLSRIKQDSRFPRELLEQINWRNIDTVAVSTHRTVEPADNLSSALHPVKLPFVRPSDPEHGPEFLRHLAQIPCELQFVCHYHSHASSAFWPSGFEEASCLVYDGGMYNSPWFGGLYRCSVKDGIVPLDRFSHRAYAKITALYSAVTAILGFRPNKHEGKITGLAALGRHSGECERVLRRLLSADYYEIDQIADWVFLYSDRISSLLLVDEIRKQELLSELGAFSREDIAATLQNVAEDHVLSMLRAAKFNGWLSENICLAGGLFSNVKLNQKIKEFGFKCVFVCPPMTDDGSAWGAALDVSKRRVANFRPRVQHTMCVGPSYSERQIEAEFLQYDIIAERIEDPAKRIAALVAEGQIVALFDGRMEFGPRALGGRSVIAQATDASINATLNKKLRRTEFMPFAPILREEDADDYFVDIPGAERCAEFMTITLNCKDLAKTEAPAVVHVDGTARPQFVDRQSSPLVYQILLEYKNATGHGLLINTSFNMHEEPIVCSPGDAIRGFLHSGIDYLFLSPNFLVGQRSNMAAAIGYFRSLPSSGENIQHNSIVTLLQQRAKTFEEEAGKQQRWLAETMVMRDKLENVIAGMRAERDIFENKIAGMRVEIDAGNDEERKLVDALAIVRQRIFIAFDQCAKIAVHLGGIVWRSLRP